MASIRTITAPTWPPRPGRLADAGRAAAFVLGVFALEALLARGVSGPVVSKYVFLFIGVFAFAAISRFELPAAIVLFAFVDFIFPAGYFARQVGPITVKPYELILACLFVLALVRPRRRTWGGTPGTALAIFLALVGFSAVLGVSAGRVSVTEAFNWARPLDLLTMFYVVVRLFPEPERRRALLGAVAVMAALTGVVAAMIALGAGFGHALEGNGENLITEEGVGSIQRVRLVGLSAGYALFWFAVVKVAMRRGIDRLFWLAIVAGIGLDIAVSFNRNMWLGLVFGLMLMVVFGGTAVRHRLAVGAAVAVAGIAVLFVFGSSSTSNKIVQPIAKRGATILNPGKTSQENSLQDRARETKAAWATAQEHLLTGVGAGAPFGAISLEPISSGSFIIGKRATPQLFLHNQYLYLVLIAGIPGLIAFLVFLGGPLLAALRRPTRDPGVTALGIGIAMIMISSVVAIYFTVDDMTAVLGLLTGVIVADAEGPAAARRPSGLVA